MFATIIADRGVQSLLKQFKSITIEVRLHELTAVHHKFVSYCKMPVCTALLLLTFMSMIVNDTMMSSNLCTSLLQIICDVGDELV